MSKLLVSVTWVRFVRHSLGSGKGPVTPNYTILLRWRAEKSNQAFSTCETNFCSTDEYTCVLHNIRKADENILDIKSPLVFKKKFVKKVSDFSRNKKLPHCRSNVRACTVSPLKVPQRRSQAIPVLITLEALTTWTVPAATGQAGFVSWVQISAWKLIHPLKVSKHLQRRLKPSRPNLKRRDRNSMMLLVSGFHSLTNFLIAYWKLQTKLIYF